MDDSRKRIQNRKRCGNVSDGKTSKLTKRLGIISIPIFTSKDLSLLNHYRKKEMDHSMDIFSST